MTSNYLKYSVISLLFLIPFVGLIVSSNLFFPYITGKNLAFRGLVEIAFALYIILALRIPTYRPKLSSIFIAFSTFIVVILAADIFGIYPFKSFWSNFERMEGFFTHLHLFVYFIMMSAVFTGEKIWTYFFQTSLGASVIMGLIGVGQIASDGGRIFSRLGNSTYLGIYMLFNIFIAGFLLVRVIERNGEKVMKWMVGITYAAVILFDFYILYNTGTRGAFLGLVVGAFFTSIAFAIWEKHKGLRILGISVLTLVILSVGSLAVFKESPFIKSHDILARFSQLATFDKAGLEQFATTQGKGRFGIWSIAYEGFKERPVLGWGQDNFNYVFNEYYDPNIYDQEQWFDRAHNVFFDWLIAGGILGLLSYLSLFVMAIIAIWRSRANERDLYFLFSDKVLLTALLIAYFIHNLFVFDSITSYILFFGILAFINIHDKKVFIIPAFTKSIYNQNYIIAGSIIGVMIAGAGFYYFTLSPYRAGGNLIKAISYQAYASTQNNPKGYEAALSSYDKALSYDSVVGITETREQLLQGAAGALTSAATPTDIRTAYFLKSKQAFENQFATTPDDTRYYLFYGSFLARVGRAASSPEMSQQGIDYLLKAGELSPRKQTVLFEIGSAYINNKQYKEALPYFRNAFESQTAYVDARFLYAVALVYAGDLKTSDEILKPLANTSYLGDIRLVRAYYDTKQLKRLDETIQFKLDYAKMLADQDQKAEAIEQIREVISLAPGFKIQGEKLIAEIEKS